MLDLLLLAVCAALGARLQRRAGSDGLRAWIWQANYVVLIPLAAAYAFLTIDLDRQLITVVACGVVAWWLTVGLAGAFAHAVAGGDERTRGALWLVGAFPNTGFLGFPLAQLAFGADGLRLAIVYDQVSLVVPAIVVATVIARRATHRTGAEEEEADAGLLRTVLVSPPLWTVVAMLALRLTLVPQPLDLDRLGTFIGHAVGPVGFLLLGLSVPLHGFAHGARDAALVSGAVLVRIAAAPALVWLVATAAGVDVPDALYLIAAMPTAFHALVIARLHGLQAPLVRLGLLVSSVVVVGGTVAWVALG